MMSSKRSHKLLLLHFAIFCLLLLQENCTEANVILCKESERKTLLEFKQSLQAVDSSGNDVLSSWKSKECCVWVGVSCNNLTGYVEKLDFRSKFKDVAEFVRLKVLNLADNSLSGPVPSSLGSLASLEMLSLRGEIPKWIGQSLSSLVFLSLRRNQFKRKMPHQLCGLKYVQILDLSLNNISGSLPSCFNNFTSMAQKLSLDQRIEHVFRKFFVIPFDPKYVDEALLTWKGTKQRNSLIGKIPQKIGQLRQLEVLDLSRNKFSSNIPTSLSELTFLSTLDLSYNYLSGKIPTGRQLQLFDPSSYSHNQGLCGPPVSPDCSMVEPPQVEHTREGEEDSINEFMKWFYTGTGLGFAVGFWGFCSVVFFKRSWRHSYYRFLDNTKDWLYVSFILMKTSLMKRIKALPTSCRRSG